MTISTTKKLAGITVAAGVIAALAGCGAAPESNGGSAGGGEAATDFLPCMVSDAGGFDDKSFNQLGYEGLLEAGDDLGVTPITVESKDESEYAGNISSLIDQNCNLIVTVGFLLAPAAAEAAEANPDVEFVSIDDMVDTDGDGKTDSENVKPLVYDTAQSAFLAGYAAAAYSTTGKVGTFGGINIPTVSVFMDGFKQGVEYFNAQNSGSVQVIGWDGSDGVFTGGFDANQDAINAAQGIVDQGVDVLLPVGGPIYQSAASVIRDSGRDIALVGVDADVYESDPSVAELMLTSIRKGMDVSVKEVVEAAAKGEFDGSPYIGTLENGGVSLAPFHDFESKVPAGLKDEIEKIKAGIIDGSIPVASYLTS
ncbi:BMP family ABC transporter substrate-binding protein [Microbacterium pseudoresistens]|uniref:Basic membrane protein A n=1 Tax=Microbacterium pseudoresistens TaxID=640634 RepID=A0A7Y9JMX9_9MICO|nr:BMP family ABC transporter substrate-binding protein [Microbacterium pseudoresistens]NYD54835.1 basic membrane protein A [Microbacterium pseudoresistens]